MNFYHQYTNRYSLSKTLRFSLIPQGKTSHYIQEGAFIEADKKKDKSYTLIKPFIDACHRDFIEESAKVLQQEAMGMIVDNKGFKMDDLDAFAEAYTHFKKARLSGKLNKDKSTDQLQKEMKEFTDAAQKLRKRLVERAFQSSLTKDKKKSLFDVSLFTEVLPSKLGSDGVMNAELLDEFKGFTTYFTGFHENRENLYTDKAQSTAIAYRLVNENFCKFLDNLELYQKNKPIITQLIDELQQADADYMQGFQLAELFSVHGYLQCLTQSGIDYYNELLGGKTEESGIKLKGLNEIINLYNQKNASKKIPAFRALFKQILSDRESVSFLPEAFTDINELYDALVNMHAHYILSEGTDRVGIFAQSTALLYRLTREDADLSQIFIAKDNLAKLSMALYGQWSIIRDALLFAYAQAQTKKKDQEKLEKAFDKINYHHLAQIHDALLLYSNELEDQELKKKLIPPIGDHVLKQFKITTKEGKQFSYSARLESLYSMSKGELSIKHERNYAPSAEGVEKIKQYLDCMMDALHYIRVFKIKREDAPSLNLNTEFYDELNLLDNEFFKLTRLYDKVRNYLTKKPFSQKKIKLNFKSPTLANGWDVNKEDANKCILLRQGVQMFLGIINDEQLKKEKTHKKKSLFILDPKKAQGKACYEKMVYKLFPDIGKMLPKCSLSLKAVKEHFKKNQSDFILNEKDTFNSPVVITRDLFELYHNEESGEKKFKLAYLKKTEDKQGYRAALTQWIEFCITFLRSYKSTAAFDFSSLKKAGEYTSLPEFYNVLNTLCYGIKFIDIPMDYVDELVEKGILLLFKIHNKDDLPQSTGTPNMHTLYWRECFSPENLMNVAIKLNGQAELFYREASIGANKRIIHASKSYLVNKMTKDGKSIPDEIYTEIYQAANGRLSLDELSPEAKRLYPSVQIKQATHDIVKDRRYTRDSFSFHVPITFNYKAEGSNKLNEAIINEMMEQSDIKIIGIDRGERHLLYLSVIDQQGRIIEQRTLNALSFEGHDGVMREVDYHNKLHLKEQGRADARKQWTQIEKIADLKSGYLSYVVHEICVLAEKYQAVIALEDLNFGFKRGRFKVEKQVYQNFEAALIKKLNFLVFKNRPLDAMGSLRHSYQLTNPFVSFNKMGKQNGILFYVPAHHTSKIDPLTGFVDRIKPKYKNAQQAREFFTLMDRICFNEQDDCFDFTYEERRFVSTATRVWTLKSWGDKRYQWSPSQKQMLSVNVTSQLKSLFEAAGIDYHDPQLVQYLRVSMDVKLLQGVMAMMRLILALRYSKGDDDFILSPIACVGKDGKNVGFDSRVHGKRLPKDADANGAYNIARKVLLMIERLRADVKNATTLSNDAWFDYAQREDICNNHLNLLE